MFEDYSTFIYFFFWGGGFICHGTVGGLFSLSIVMVMSMIHNYYMRVVHFQEAEMENFNI